MHTRWRALFAGVVLSVACTSGCFEAVEEDGIPQPSVRITDAELQVIFWRWRNSLSAEEREVLDKEIMWREDLLIHVFLGHIPKKRSRGGMSTVAKQARKDGWCTRHPEAEDIPWYRNWDSMYDPQAASSAEEQSKIPQPLEVALHHEFFGHILPALKDPGLWDRLREHPELQVDDEVRALAIENEYRRRLGLPEVPVDVDLLKWFFSREHLPASSAP